MATVMVKSITGERGFDGGDCIEMNEQYPECTNVTDYFENCNGGQYNIAECGFDGEICLDVNQLYLE